MTAFISLNSKSIRFNTFVLKTVQWKRYWYLLSCL